MSFISKSKFSKSKRLIRRSFSLEVLLDYSRANINSGGGSLATSEFLYTIIVSIGNIHVTIGIESHSKW